MPHACGALDGKHIACRRPRNSGSLYFNYKCFFSLVLMGLVDADYKFLWIDVGGYGHMSDAQNFNASELKECFIEDNSIAFPAADPLPNDDIPTPYFILGDDAFGLRTYLMKPFAQRQMTKDQRILPITDCQGVGVSLRMRSASWLSVGRSSSLRCNTTP